MRDADVRKSLHLWLRDEHRAELDATRILDEMDVAGQVRIDTVVLNGSFAGFEIKSASDTLRRLPRQIEVYSQVLDFATLVVAKNHAAKAKDLLPRWWGVIEASSVSDGVQLRRVRKARRNATIDPMTLCTLLWRQETLSELEIRGTDAGVRSKPNRFLWERLAETVSPDELRDIVRERVKFRAGWRAETPSPLHA
ncbi:hypothetical protein GOEFS_023_00040 [Gordonia effusa NBRC 100432]|uniref:Sce7726 family protein n=1 Tax=Gordonia effusa NBRC 100432 TaxID=1077974 RepID=H0QWT5_9ACTN|nr:sce7726 family protein [Gordonia effusa]GAB17286.1 hypothetical protein GOEFS_023_00040 [Gordonia effusa NBRC 100432]